MEKKIYDDQLIIITGALGFIGSAVVRQLNDQGYKNLILVDDIRTTSKWKNVVGKRFFELISRYELFHFLEGREKEIEAIIHLGACADTLETDGDYLMENNYRYSIALAEFALKNQIRFIYASSAATYGLGEEGYSDEHERLPDLKPLNCYAFSKHLFDLWAYEQNILNQVVGLKFFNVFGPNEYHKGKMASMIYHLYHQILDTKKVKLFESNNRKLYRNGDQVRDFIYVKDAVAMTCGFLENDQAGIYNIGSGQGTTWNELAEILFKKMGVKPDIEYIPMPENIVKTYQNYTLADMSKYRQNEKKKARYSLEQAIEDYLSHYLQKGSTW